MQDSPTLFIDREAIAKNWHALNSKSDGNAAAVVKANAYGLGVDIIAKILWKTGVREYFVATPSEAFELYDILNEAVIYDLSGLSLYHPHHPNIIPVINSLEMLAELDNRPFALQFNTGMTRLGLDEEALNVVSSLKPSLIMSHLACSDEANHDMNAAQLKKFQLIREAFPNTRTSLSATGGILLGDAYQFDLTRPGIGIYGGAPFVDANPTIQISLPILQIREIEAGTTIGYGASYQATSPMRVATVLGGYADGINRALSSKANLYFEDTPCPILGRISMDAITADISALQETPKSLDLFHKDQNLNDLAKIANTIPYELLTSLGNRYKREEI